MKKDSRKISLDPMEWRDAMRDVKGEATKEAPKKKAAPKPKAKAKKPSGTRR
jgi:hypothetical protein